MRKLIRVATRVVARRKAAKVTPYPTPEETIHVLSGLEAPPLGTGTYTPPAQYRVLKK